MMLLALLTLGPALRYSYTELPLLPGGAQAVARAINDHGIVAGDAEVPFPIEERTYQAWRASVWDGGPATNLGILPPSAMADVPQSHAYAINRAGWTVGASGGYTPMFMSGLHDCTAFIWKSGILAPLSSDMGTFEAYDINDSGGIVGCDGYRGFLTRKGKVVEVGTLSSLPEGNGSQANGINNRGEIVGASTINGKTINYELPVRPFIIRSGKMRALPVPKGTQSAVAWKIDDRGQIIGWTGTRGGYKFAGTSGPGEAVLWVRGRPTILPHLPGATETRALGLRGDIIVGKSGGSAVAWIRGQIVDLNGQTNAPQGTMLTEAAAVNSNGWIVGTATRNGKSVAFLLLPQN